MIDPNIHTAELSHAIKIAYTESGKQHKTVLLFIHGLANYMQVWQWNTIVLQNHARCIAIDLPGNGHSSRGNHAYSIDFMSEKVYEFIQVLKLENVILVGHSMGGQIALNMALKYPDTVQKLLLFAPSGFEYFAPHEVMMIKGMMNLGGFMNMDELHLSQSINSSFYKHSIVAKKIIEDLTLIIQNNDRNQYRRMVDRCIASMLDHQLFYQLKNIQQETLVFFGDHDMLIPNKFLHPQQTKEIARKAVAQMKHANLIMYAEAGHFIQIEQAAEVNADVIKFLNANTQ